MVSSLVHEPREGNGKNPRVIWHSRDTGRPTDWLNDNKLINMKKTNIKVCVHKTLMSSAYGLYHPNER